MASEQTSISTRHAFSRFSIKMLLVAVLIAAGTFAGYRRGVDVGRQQGPIVPTDISDSKIYSRDYDVSDIATTDAELETLVDAIYRTAEPDDWAINGGYAELNHDADEGLLNVSHVWPGHIAVVKFLQTFREFAQYSNSFEEAIENACGNY